MERRDVRLDEQGYRTGSVRESEKPKWGWKMGAGGVGGGKKKRRQRPESEKKRESARDGL